MTDRYEIVRLPPGTIIDLDSAGYICRCPNGTVIRYSIEVGPKGPAVVETVFPLDGPITYDIKTIKTGK